MTTRQQMRVLGTCAGCLGEFVVPGPGRLYRVFCGDSTPDPDDEFRRRPGLTLGVEFSALLCDECRELVTVAELLKHERVHPFPPEMRRTMAWRRSWREFWRRR